MSLLPYTIAYLRKTIFNGLSPLKTYISLRNVISFSFIIAFHSLLITDPYGIGVYIKFRSDLTFEKSNVTSIPILAAEEMDLEWDEDDRDPLIRTKCSSSRADSNESFTPSNLFTNFEIMVYDFIPPRSPPPLIWSF